MLKHVGWMVLALGGQYMYWPVDEKDDALSYCEDGCEPVKIFATEAELQQHERGETPSLDA